MSTSKIRTTLTVAFAHRGNQSVRIKAIYEPNDPYAVHLAFPSPTGRRELIWTFARSLLVHGMRQQQTEGPVGEGDITVGPAEARNYVEIVLHPFGRATTRLYARRDELTSFVAQSYKRVPDEQEDDWIDWREAWSWLHRCVLQGGAA